MRSVGQDGRAVVKTLAVSGVGGLLVGLAVATSAWAQGQMSPPPTQPAMALPAPAITIEFDAAVRTAIEKNPTAAEAATAINRAEALLAQARAVLQPTASATVSDAINNSSIQFQGNTITPRSQVTITGDISMAIFSAARWAAMTQAADQVDVSRVSASDVRRQVAVSTAQAYLGIIAARRQLEVQDRALANARAHLDYADRRLQGGAGTRVDEQRAAQQVSTDEAAIANTQLALLQAEEALGVLLTVDGPVAAGAEPAFEMPSSVDVAQGLSARTDVRLQRVGVTAAERVFGDSRKDWWPTGTVSFDPTYITPVSAFQPAKTWRLTVSFTQQLFDGGQRKAVARQRETAVESSKLGVNAVEIQARSEIRVAQASVDTLARALVSAQLAVNQANEVLRITTTAFEVGATTNLEVIDAERSARDAETAAAVAEDAVRHAKLDLLVALGRFPR